MALSGVPCMNRMSGGTRQSQRPFLASRKAVTVRATADVNNLMKKPELKRPAAVEVPAKTLFGDNSATPADAPAPLVASSQAASSKVITIEYQRARAKEIRKYFQENKLQESATQARGYGWVKSAEINNGRWVMFGWGVGLLTEYATGVNFIAQLKLMVTYLGIADLD